MGHHVIFDNRKIGHCDVLHRTEGIVTVPIDVQRSAFDLCRQWKGKDKLCNDNVAPPCILFSEGASLNFATAFVNWKRHAVFADSWIEHDVWVGELLVHPVEGLHELKSCF